MSKHSYKLVDSPTAVAEMVDVLGGLKLSSESPSLYVDLEGEYLSRLGTISIIQIYVAPKRHTYLVDVCTLGDSSFSTPGASGLTLKDILESPSTIKVFFDVRNDSDALFSHFKVKLQGIHDLQLMELASRTFSRRHVAGLAKCIEKDAAMTSAELMVFKEVKQRGHRLFDPDIGGSYKVFNERPLSKNILDYCVQDVEYLPRLWEKYRSKLTPLWMQRVIDCSKERVRESQSPAFNGKGRHMALGPTAWAAY